jgi:hypothetical protein
LSKDERTIAIGLAGSRLNDAELSRYFAERITH